MSRVTLRELLDMDSKISSNRYVVIRIIQTACLCAILLVLAKITGCATEKKMLCENIGILEIGGLVTAITAAAGATLWGGKREEVKKEIALIKEKEVSGD